MICGTVSTVGGLIKGIDRCIASGFDGTQVYVTESRRWTTRLHNEEKAETIRKYAEEKKILMLAHVPFLVNVMTPDWFLRNRSIERLKQEIISCGQLGVQHLIMHPGNLMGQEQKVGIERLDSALKEVLPLCDEWDVKLLLETMSGMGTQYGSPEELWWILNNYDPGGKLGVCIDTAHLHGAGEDLDETIELFDGYIGCFHLNGTKVKFGSKLDRHCSIFEGEIPVETFEKLVKRFPKLPHVLEFTQSDKTGEEQIKHLKGVVKC